MIQTETHKVPKLAKPQRMQDYGVGIFPSCPTKSGLKKHLKKGNIKINGRKASTATFVKGGEEISLTIKEVSTHKVKDLKLCVYYEDEALAVIHKPAGIAVYGNQHRTIANALALNIQPSSAKDACTPRAVHRLDYPTSGLLIVGKTAASVRELNQAFENKKISKTYLAICCGSLPLAGESKKPLDGKSAHTKWKVLASEPSDRFKKLSLVELTPITGRKHQLRLHMSLNSNHILGDPQYSPEGLELKGKGMYLTAMRLEFSHPLTREQLKINGEIPKKYLKIFPDSTLIKNNFL